MGASSSSSSSSEEQKEIQEQESLAQSTASLPFLRLAFASLSQSTTIPTPSFERLFSLNPNISPTSKTLIPNDLPSLLPNLGSAVAALLFPDPQEEISYLRFLRGYNRCCARMPASSSLDLLLQLYSLACRRSQIPCGLEFDPEAEKVGGSLTADDLGRVLAVCWLMERSWRVGNDGGGEVVVVVPELGHLVASALDGDEARVETQKVRVWVVGTVPGVVNCFPRFVQERIKACTAAAPAPTASLGDSVLSAGEGSSNDVENSFLLTCGRAWSISLTLRSTLSEELSKASFPELVKESLGNILYRSSIHGKGLNRFWSNVEGYHGPILVLISICPVDTTERSVIGILTDQGFENRDTFYGNSGFLYAISPIFHVFSPSGKEKNFIYCHLHPTGRVYEPKPKPVGLGFGGTMGNERIFIDEDFAKVTVRHHAVDKTYQHGSLIPNQGYLPMEASVLEVEVWGFGGKAAKEQQDAYRKRETLFTEQRRKVDMKTFGSWDDSPEKMMMDMISDPNAVRREDR